MKQQKEKGITLVALVITIIVLVILVGVSVSTALNTGLIGNSKTSVGQYEVAQKNEISQLDDVLDALEGAKRTWKQVERDGNVNGPKILAVTDGKGNTFDIGDEVTYTQKNASPYVMSKEYTGGSSDQTISKDETIAWKVLGVNKNGRLLLVSSKRGNSVKLYDEAKFSKLEGAYDEMYNQLYGNDELNTKARAVRYKDISWLYGKDKRYPQELFPNCNYRRKNSSIRWF